MSLFAPGNPEVEARQLLGVGTVMRLPPHATARSAAQPRLWIPCPALPSSHADTRGCLPVDNSRTPTARSCRARHPRYPRHSVLGVETAAPARLMSVRYRSAVSKRSVLIPLRSASRHAGSLGIMSCSCPCLHVRCISQHRCSKVLRYA
mgnify:CR=1 FL=1